MIIKIENENLSVKFNTLGAELYSLKSIKTGVEFVWQGNKEYWGGRAPLLFPICGRLVEGKYIYKDKEYFMELHGFVRKNEFVLKSISQDKILFELNSSEKTREIFPFDFKLEVGFELKGKTLIKHIKVTNLSEEVMPFSFGGHPGFNVPLVANTNFEDYYIEFPKNELNRIIFSDKCFHTGKRETYQLDNKKLHLRHDLFDNDALFFEMESGSVKLMSDKTDYAIEMTFNDMTCLGLWHAPKTDAPYVCIEPWHGVPSDDGVVDDLATKKQMIKLKSGKTYENTCQVKVDFE